MAATEKKTRTKRAKAPLTTRDNLSALIGGARKILRKDKGLNGDVDRLPLLTWVMCLKFLDDLLGHRLLVPVFRRSVVLNLKLKLLRRLSFCVLYLVRELVLILFHF